MQILKISQRVCGFAADILKNSQSSRTEKLRYFESSLHATGR